MNRERLYKSSTHQVISGVLGGVAEHLHVDPVLVRLIFILLTFATGLGFGIIVYVIAAVVIPERGSATPPPVPPTPTASVPDDHSDV